jgi:hypothetical protein
MRSQARGSSNRGSEWARVAELGGEGQLIPALCDSVSIYRGFGSYEFPCIRSQDSLLVHYYGRKNIELNCLFYLVVSTC